MSPPGRRLRVTHTLSAACVAGDRQPEAAPGASSHPDRLAVDARDEVGRTVTRDDQRATSAARRVGAEGQPGHRHGLSQLGPARPLLPAVRRVEPQVAGQGGARARGRRPGRRPRVSGGGSIVQRPRVDRTTSNPCRQRVTSSSGVQFRGSASMNTASNSIAGSCRTTASRAGASGPLASSRQSMLRLVENASPPLVNG